MHEFKYGEPLIDADAILAAFEQRHGIVLPTSYKSAVRENDGDYPKPASCLIYDFVRERSIPIACDRLIPFGGGEMDQVCQPEAIAMLPDHILPFGEEAGGLVFAFDYRGEICAEGPPVVLFVPDYAPDNSILPVAASFEDFLAGLSLSTPRP